MEESYEARTHNILILKSSYFFDIIIGDTMGTCSLTSRSSSGISGAKNLKELSDYLVQNYEIRVDQISLKNVDFELVKDAAQGIINVVDEFPEAKDYFHELRGDGKLKNAYAFATFYGEIAINPNKFDSSSSVNRRYESDLKTGFHPAGTTYKQITSHEAGHILEKALIDKYVTDARGGIFEKAAKVNAWNKHWQAQKVISEAVKAVKKTPYGKGKRQAELFNSVSRYASKNRSETLAECIADYVANKENANPLSVQVWNIMKRELG